MKVKYLIPVLLAVLVFSFIGCSTPKVAATKTTVDESKVYVDKIGVIFLSVIGALSYFNQSMEDSSNGKISISKHKQDTSDFIKDINDCYNTFLSLKAPEKFNTPHELMGKGMEHLFNATIYLQQYVNSDNIGNMADYLKKANSEILMGFTYINKAIEQYNNLK